MSAFAYGNTINEFLAHDQQKDLLRFLTAGSVDDGKSTLIGRLLFDSKKIYEDQLAALERDNLREGHAGDDMDYALLLDGLKAEREQGITIDVAYRYFSTNRRKFIIADTPGHEQYTRNMVTGASTADLVIILVDARQGIVTQTKRHTFIAALLGIKHVVLAVNKMDLVDYSQRTFEVICTAYKDFVTRLGIPDVHCIPLSALRGDNVVTPSEHTAWYDGRPLLHFLETVHVAGDRNFIDFRYPVQYVIRPSHGYRGYAARVASGIVRKGDELLVLPSRKKSVVASITTWDGELEEAFPPQSVTLTLKDDIDISRGDLLVKPGNVPKVGRHFEAMLVWLAEEPMTASGQYLIKHTTNTSRARIDEIRYRIDVNTLQRSGSEVFGLNDIGRAVLTVNKPLFFDSYAKNRETGAFILIDSVGFNTVAAGMIIDRVGEDELPSKISGGQSLSQAVARSLVPLREREKRMGQKSATVWIMGLHGSAKNDVASRLDKALFDKGATTVLFDGGTVRSGLSSELDYSPTDRAEHLRRVAHLCRMLNDQGFITICSFISPDANIRRQVAEIVGVERFHLVYVDASQQLCRKLEPELYEQVERGAARHLPGVDLPFEPPQRPDVRLCQQTGFVDISKILDYLAAGGVFPLD
ncbi:sulfate adenylyltransferase subunit CysN [Prosthecochloris sp. GSB1]|uniref:sulfate adenylyltransferase subunit CysN n=1 Tax=Prosthecochloris sp. GSB1 TaxID=281093 RepID=UPI000B8D0664|nr:sulfate adenylyltransferase subunit CysN [Prosthecochloris sp. GSB1]ASQ89834.1 sulfate adenylyltransferase subunit CysN [Prosthecochloris sp. GSB1]